MNPTWLNRYIEAPDGDSSGVSSKGQSSTLPGTKLPFDPFFQVGKEALGPLLDDDRFGKEAYDLLMNFAIPKHDEVEKVERLAKCQGLPRHKRH